MSSSMTSLIGLGFPERAGGPVRNSPMGRSTAESCNPSNPSSE